MPKYTVTLHTGYSTQRTHANVRARNAEAAKRLVLGTVPSWYNYAVEVQRQPIEWANLFRTKYGWRPWVRSFVDVSMIIAYLVMVFFLTHAAIIYIGKAHV